MNISRTLLHDPEDSNLNFIGQPAEIKWNIEVDSYLAALRESVHIPAERGDELRIEFGINFRCDPYSAQHGDVLVRL
jgi:hypothetical protein